MSISSLVLQTTPRRQSALRLELENIRGVQIHALTRDGRMVITVDEPDQFRAAEIMAQIPHMDGVIKMSLICKDQDGEFSQGEG